MKLLEDGIWWLKATAQEQVDRLVSWYLDWCARSVDKFD